jgi:integration host factor subunit alpha
VRDAEELVELVLAEIVGALARSESVKVASFGTFTMRRKAGRVGRNPKTGEAAPISPRKVVVFRPSQILKGRLRGGLAKNELHVQRLSSRPAPERAVKGGTIGASRGRRTARQSG